MRIAKPTLLINEETARRNIRKMAAKAASSGVTLRPHFKTHQSADIGKIFQNEGIEKVTVSSVDMAVYFSRAGWKDITIAFPYNPLEAAEMEGLAHQIQLNVLITSKAALDHLNRNVNAPLGYYIKVDVGTHRTGVDPNDRKALQEVSASGNEHHRLKGLLAHAGHAYKALNQEEALRIFHHSTDLMEKVKKSLERENLLISYGDTPTCTLVETFTGIDEVRPGNFVFYDTMQHSFGVCALEDIAVCLACPVVSVHPDRNEAVVYGGAVHLSKEYILENENKSFGTVVNLRESSWEATSVARVDRLSQEHGIIKGSNHYINSLRPGDLVGILPVHSCLTADLQGYYVSLTGKRFEKLNKVSV